MTPAPGKLPRNVLKAILDAQARAREAQKSGRLAEGIQTIDAAIKRLGEDAALAALKKDLAAQLEARRRDEETQAALRQARDFLAKNDPTSATQILQILQRVQPQARDNKQIAELLAAAETKLTEQKREQAIAVLTQEVNKLGAEGRFEQALRTLDGALAQFPGVEHLERLRRPLLAGQARVELLALAKRLHGEGQFDAALQKTQEALRTEPLDTEFLRLKSAIEADLAKQRQLAEIRKTMEQAQAMLRADHLNEAVALLQRTAVQYPAEKQVSDLLRTVEEELRKRQRAKECEDGRAQAQSLLSQNKQEEAIALIEGRFANEPSFQDLLLRAKKELDAKQRDALLQQAVALGREQRFEEAVQLVDQAVSRHGSTDAAVELRRRLQAELDQQLRRKARDRDRAQLLALEQQIGTNPPKRKLNKLAAEAQSIAARYAADQEIAAIAGRIQQAVLAVPEEKGLSPRLLVGGGVGVAVLIGAAVFFLRSPSPAPPPVIAPVAVEIHTDPPGASVRIEDRSCVTPTCRFDLKPGQYQLEARLNGYQTIQQAVNVEPDKGSRIVELTLQPVPAPPPPPGDTTPATGTLVVRAGVPGALVYIDGAARSRTDQSGSVTLPLEAKTYEVRVERNGYDKPAAQKVTIAKGGRQAVSFQLVQQVAKVESHGPLPGAEKGGGKPSGGTDIGSLHPTSNPDGSRAKEEAARLAETAWNALDKNNIEAVRKFARENPDNPHKTEAQKILDQYDAAQQRLAQEREKQEQIKKDLARQEQAKQELAKQELAKQELQRKQQVVDTLKQLDSALQRKRAADVKTLWPTASKLFFDSLRSGQVAMSLSANEEDVQFPQGPDQAVARGILSTRATGTAPRQQSVTFTLRNTGGTWKIEQMRVQ